MWANYLKVASEQAGHTIQSWIAFNIMKKFKREINESAHKKRSQLAADGYEPVLKNSRWCLLKRREKSDG